MRDIYITPPPECNEMTYLILINSFTNSYPMCFYFSSKKNKNQDNEEEIVEIFNA